MPIYYTPARFPLELQRVTFTMSTNGTLSVETKRPNDAFFEAISARLPQQARDSFSAEQMEALRASARLCGWGQHPVDIRISIPLLVKRIYLVIVAGSERRQAERRRRERRQHPVARPANFATLLGLTVAGTLLGSLVFYFVFSWYLTV